MKLVRVSLVVLAVATPALAADPPNAPKISVQPTPALAPPRLPDDASRVLKVKGPIGNNTFKAIPEIQKIAADRLAAIKKTAKPAAASGPTTITISPSAPRPTDAGLYYQKPASTRFLDTPDFPVSIHLNATMSRTFVEGLNVSAFELDFKATAGNMYVADCPAWGAGQYHVRLKTKNIGPGTSWVTRETKHATGNTPMTWIAEQDAIIRVTLQGFIPDGEEYTWGVDACRITTIPYS